MVPPSGLTAFAPRKGTYLDPHDESVGRLCFLPNEIDNAR